MTIARAGEVANSSPSASSVRAAEIPLCGRAFIVTPPFGLRRALAPRFSPRPVRAVAAVRSVAPVRAVAAMRAVAPVAAVGPVTAVGPVAPVGPVTAVRAVAPVASVAAVRGVRQVLSEDRVLAVRLRAQRARRVGRLERDVRLKRLAGLLAAEEIHRRLAQQRQPLLLVAHVGSFTWVRSTRPLPKLREIGRA